MKQRFAPTISILFFIITLVGQASAADRPNVILIIADDMGFSDIGSYGSEVETPNLDKLAFQGMRFTQFYNMSKCEATRSSLFTGRFLAGKHIENAIPFSQLMRKAGYYTAMVGKEHFMPWVPARCFAVNSFEDSFVFWKINSYFVPPSGEFEYPFRLNGVPIPPEKMDVRIKPLFKTDVMTNYALTFLDKANDSKKPFFLYLPYHVGHYPLQAREEDIGANVGNHTLAFSTMFDQVLSFEPFPIVAERLERKASMLTNVEVFRVALSDRNGVMKFAPPETQNWGQGRIDPEGKLEVEVAIGDEYLRNRIEEPVNFIKIDVEGHELQVLSGLSETISKDRPVVMFEIPRELRKERSWSLKEAYDLFPRDYEFSAFRNQSTFPIQVTQARAFALDRSKSKSLRKITNALAYGPERGIEIRNNRAVKVG